MATSLKRIGTVSTTDATVTTVVTIALPTSGDAVSLIVTALAVKDDNTADGVATAIVAVNATGTVTASEVELGETGPLGNLAITGVASGTNVLVRVTGIAGTNLTWTVLVTGVKNT